MSRRISIIGSCCSGKTTLAARLAERLGVTHVELDALHHGPNWQEATADELRAKVEETLAELDGWVVDGNYMIIRPFETSWSVANALAVTVGSRVPGLVTFSPR